MKWLTIVTLLIGNIAFAEPQTYPPQGLMMFRGLDNKSSPTAVQDGRASDLLNVSLGTTYALSKRGGYDLVNDEVLDLKDRDYAAVTGLYYTKLSTGTAYRIATVDRRLYYDNAGTWTMKSQAFTPDYQFVFTTALDKIYFTNDYDIPKVWSPTAPVLDVDFSDLTTAVTKAKCVAWFRNYLILGNTYEAAEYPTRIRWSNVGTTETYTDANYIDIAARGGQEIEAFGILYDNLYIFLTNSVWKLSLVGGDEVFVLSKVVDGIGCIAKNSVQTITLQNTQTGLIFLDDDGEVYFFNGITAQYISLLIEATMDGLNAARLQYAVSASDGTDYFLCAANGTSTTNDLLLDFQYDIGEWTKHDHINANAMCKVIDSDSDEQIWFGNYDSMVLEWNSLTSGSDVYGAVGTIESVSTGSWRTNTASGLQIVYDSSQSWTTSGLTGAIIEITSGTALAETRVIVDNTSSGVAVDTDFTTTPDTTSTYIIGQIDSYYKTKWYDLGHAPLRKQLQEVFLWAEEKGDMEIEVSYTRDFLGTLGTESVSMLGAGDLWDAGIWGEALWGGQEALFSRIKTPCTGRYFKVEFSEDDIDEYFELYGFSFIFEARGIW